MNVFVIGAGMVGEPLARRLASDPIVSGIYWANRSGKHDGRSTDIRQGLSLTPTCRFLSNGLYTDRFFERASNNSDVAVIVAGESLKADETNRDVLYPKNCHGFYFDSGLVRLLTRHKPRVTIVVTNPVDLMTRYFYQQCGLDPASIIGLGTVVETARIRAELASYARRFIPNIRASEVWAYAIGTHNKLFVAVIPRIFSTAGSIEDEKNHATVRSCAVDLARRGPEQIKSKGDSTSFAIVEATMKVIRAVLLDTRETLTVSVLDPDDPAELFYSVPAVVGNRGVVPTIRPQWAPEELSGLEKCKESMRAILARYPFDPKRCPTCGGALPHSTPMATDGATELLAETLS